MARRLRGETRLDFSDLLAPMGSFSFAASLPQSVSCNLRRTVVDLRPTDPKFCASSLLAQSYAHASTCTMRGRPRRRHGVSKMRRVLRSVNLFKGLSLLLQ